MTTYKVTATYAVIYTVEADSPDEAERYLMTHDVPEDDEICTGVMTEEASE